MPSPTITAIIPTFRRPTVLRRAIESVLAQTYPHFKLLVCDNASGDETAEVVGEYSRRDPRVDYHCQPENLGMIPNFSYGMDAVDTEYFSILCDDDLLLPRFYEHAMETLARYPQARFFCGQAALYQEGRGTHGLRPRRHWTNGFYEAGRWVPRMLDLFFTISGCVFSSDMRPTVLPFEPSTMTDVVLLLRAAASFPFAVSLMPGAVIVDTGESATGLVSVEELHRSYGIMKQCCDDLPGLTGAEREQVNELLEKHFRVVANGLLRDALEAGDRQRFEELAVFAVSRGGLDWRRRLRVAMARPSGATPWLFPLVRVSARLGSSYKRKRKSRGGRQTLEEVVALYSGTAT